MRKLFLLTNFLLVSNVIFALTADQIIKFIDDNLTFNEGEMVVSIIDIKNNKVNKQLKANIKFKKDTGTLMEFISPAREKNKKILMIKDNMWLFVPGISRPIRLSGKDSFMGTSFSNRDLMDFDMNNDYKGKIIESTDDIYVLDLAATNKNVTYPRVVVYVDRNSLLPRKEELYTISGNLIKTIDFLETKNFSGKIRPSIIIVKDVLTQGNETKIVLETMVEKNVNETIFSPQNVER